MSPYYLQHSSTCLRIFTNGKNINNVGDPGADFLHNLIRRQIRGQNSAVYRHLKPTDLPKLRHHRVGPRPRFRGGTVSWSRPGRFQDTACLVDSSVTLRHSQRCAKLLSVRLLPMRYVYVYDILFAIRYPTYWRKVLEAMLLHALFLMINLLGTRRACSRRARNGDYNRIY